MKILFYCDEYPPAKHGGIGSVVKIVAEALVNKGHEIFVVGTYQYGHGFAHFTVINGVKIYRLTHFNHLEYFPKVAERTISKILRECYFLSYVAEKGIKKTENFIDSLIKTKKIDCLELVDYMGLLNFLRREVYFRKFEIPTVMRVHGSPSFLMKNKNKVDKVWLKNDINNFGRCDRISAVSKFSAKYVIENLKIGSKKINVIYNPVENSFLADKPQVSKKNKILFVGKIVETKGAYSLLRSFNLIAGSNPELELILIGSGNIHLAKGIVKQEFRDRVYFTGYLSRNEIIKNIDESLFCIVPSYFENFGMVPLEIMARGKALIYTTRASGPEIITHLVDGLLVEPTNIESIVSNVKVLLNNKEFRDKLGSEAYKKIQNNFLIDKIILELEEYYGSIIKKKHTVIK